MVLERKSGILLHPTSLPGRFGIGTLGKEAFNFIDFLAASGQKLWQICPLGPTGYGDSPYQCFSAFAGNPLLIDLDKLADEGLLLNEDIEIGASFDENHVDYGKVINIKYPVLRKAYNNNIHIQKDGEKRAFTEFCLKNSFWLDDYALFMALKSRHNGAAWSTWEKEYRNHHSHEILNFKKKAVDEITFQKFMQFVFFKQWNEIKKYANSKHIKIIGDIPLFVAFDSSDAWSHPEYFYFNKNREPVKVAGVPPDYFSETGQLWGNPLYNWKRMKKRGYYWWKNRFEITMELFDYIRLDHFRGFAAYWAVPYGDKTAIGGKWEKGPGKEFFKSMEKFLGELPIIAEDLGYITPDVIDLRKSFHMPGMKILQFAFGSGPENPYLPHHYPKSCVVYTGTHDNDTITGWYKSLGQTERDFVKSYLTEVREINWDIIRLAWSSVTEFAITPLQDVLGLGNEGRMNLPGTSNGNWQWRFGKKALDDALVKRLLEMTKLYSR